MSHSIILKCHSRRVNSGVKAPAIILFWALPKENQHTLLTVCQLLCVVGGSSTGVSVYADACEKMTIVYGTLIGCSRLGSILHNEFTAHITQRDASVVCIDLLCTYDNAFCIVSAC